MFTNIITNLKSNYATILLIFPIYAWYRYLKTLKQLKEKRETWNMFQKKHNCVVMYQAAKGMSGWPEYPERIKLSLINLSKYSEPLEYFINTAEKTIDIAVMMISIKPVVDAMLNALNRGVGIRIIINHEHMKNNSSIRSLSSAGAEILYFINYDVESIMHYKYAVKDTHDGGGYVMCGSLNWTQSALMENYEDLVFTSSEQVVRIMHCNFEETWKFLQMEKATNELVKFSLNDL